MCKSLKQRIEDGRITGLVGLACFVASQALAADNSVQDPVQTELQEIRERLQRLEAARPTPKDSDKGALSSVPRFRVSDGLIIEDSDGKWSVRATARAMTDYRDYLDSPAKADTFSLRRARIGLGFTVNKEFTGFLESELVFGAGTQAGTAASAGLLQGFLEYAPSPRARLRLGQFKPQFMLEATMSPFHVDFQERSLMFNLLQNFPRLRQAQSRCRSCRVRHDERRPFARHACVVSRVPREGMVNTDNPCGRTLGAKDPQCHMSIGGSSPT